MSHSLYEFQETGSGFLIPRRRAFNADSMGLGKTVQGCHAASVVKPSDTLVICPASAIPNWEYEWGEWGPQRGDLEVISFERAVRSKREKHALVMVDEAHYCKNRSAQRTRAALGFARAADQSWLFSGTPYKHPGDLWPAIYALWPGIPRQLGLTTHGLWFNHFCNWYATSYGPRVSGIKNFKELKPYLDRLMIRRTPKTAGIKLPPIRVDVSLLPKSTDFNRSLREYGTNPTDLTRRMEYEKAHDCPSCHGDGERDGAECGRCRGSGTVKGHTSRLRRLVGEYKAPFIADQLIQELEDEEYVKIVVMAHHRSVLGILRQKLGPFGVVGFDGSTSPRNRQRAIEAFKSGSPRVFVAQQSAAGISINLQISTEIVLIEPDWDPDVNAQAILRIRRIGSKHPCRARIFAVAGSVDEAVMRTAGHKTQMQIEQGLLEEEAA